MNNKHVLIVEKQQESLHINESKTSNKFLLSGIFTEFDIENRNKRFYTAENFIPCMNTLLEKKKMLSVIYGEFDHPDVFDIAGKSVSHAIEDLTHNEQNNRIDGTIAVLSTHYGKEARAIINDGYPLFVSSRAAGVTDNYGNVALKELFTYDIVLDPGFASAQVSINESFGLKSTPDVNYRIYELNESRVNDLFNDNKNDGKTNMDLKAMETFLADELAKIEHKLLTQISEGKSSNEEILALTEKYELVNEELNKVTEYLKVFIPKFNTLVKKNEELEKANEDLNNEINENTLYYNHLAAGFKNIKEKSTKIENRLQIAESFTEQVASESQKTFNQIKESLTNATNFVNYVANETAITQKFAEFIAKETDITQKFVESVAKETETAQKFTEMVAGETDITQKFVENLAKETEKIDIYNTYIAEKVDGIIKYTKESISRVKNSLPLNENLESELNIQKIEDIDTYLGTDIESAIYNNIQEDYEDEEETQENTDMTSTEETEETQENTEDTSLMDDTTSTEDTSLIDDTTSTEDTSLMDDTTSTEDTSLMGDTTSLEPELIVSEEPENNSDIENNLLNSLVKLFGSDETGIVIEVIGDKVIIQKSGSDETVEAGVDEYEVIDTNENIAETVSDVLAEIKRQKIVSNQTPHFFNFLNEQQIDDFKNLDLRVREQILEAIENTNYTSSDEILNVIGNILNQNAMPYEDKLISNVPEELKESWNNMTKEQKIGIITESKYFPLVTTADFKNFWNTRPFAKALNSPEATLIKESNNIVNNDQLDENYLNAFLNTLDNLNK